MVTSMVNGSRRSSETSNISTGLGPVGRWSRRTAGRTSGSRDHYPATLDVRTGSFVCSPEPRASCEFCPPTRWPVEYGGVMTTADLKSRGQRVRSRSSFEPKRPEARCLSPARARRSSWPIPRGLTPTTACGRRRSPLPRAGTAVADAASVDQRRADGGLLPPRRAGDQTRGDRRRAGVAAPGGAADRRRDRRHGRPGVIYVADERRRRWRRAAGRFPWRPTSPSRWACWRCGAARAQSGSRSFWLALAIVDDMGAVLVIALFYTASHRVGRAGDGGPVLLCSLRSNVLRVRQADALPRPGCRALVLSCTSRACTRRSRACCSRSRFRPGPASTRRSSRPRLGAAGLFRSNGDR